MNRSVVAVFSAVSMDHVFQRKIKVLKTLVGRFSLGERRENGPELALFANVPVQVVLTNNPLYTVL